MIDEESDYGQKMLRRIVIILLVLVIGGVVALTHYSAIKRRVAKTQVQLDEYFEPQLPDYLDEAQKDSLTAQVVTSDSDVKDLTRKTKEEVHILDEPEHPWYLTKQDLMEYWTLLKDMWNYRRGKPTVWDYEEFEQNQNK